MKRPNYSARSRADRRSSESGQSVSEYALIIVLVGVAAIVIIQLLGPALGNVFSRFGRRAPVAPPSLVGYTPPATLAPTQTLAPTATWPPGFTPSPTPPNTPTSTPFVTATPTGTLMPTGTATPTLGNCQFVEVGGQVVVEAESLIGGAPAQGNMNAWVTTTSYGGYAGTSALISLPNDGDNMLLTLNGPRVDYGIYLQTPGNYYFYVRGRPDPVSPADNDSIMAGVAGSSFTQIGSGFGGWTSTSNFTWRRWPIPLNFPAAGLYTINIWMREDGMVVDRFAMSTNDALFSDGSTAVGPAQSPAPGGCTGAPPPPPPGTATPSSTPTVTRTPTPSRTPTVTSTPAGTATPTRTPSPTPSRTPSPTPTRTPSPTPSPTVPAPTILDIQVEHDDDDAEERVSNGSMTLGSSRLELGQNGANPYLVGLRFYGINVPRGATITNAFIRFTTDATDSGTASFTIVGQAGDNPPRFNGNDNNISNRPATTASVSWPNVPAWTNLNETHNTPDLRTIVQQLVNRGGWNPGNSMVFIISGSGTRRAESHDGNAGEAAVLHIEYLP